MKNVFVFGSLGFLQSNYLRSTCKDYKTKFSISSMDKCVDKSKIKDIYINKNNDFYIADIYDYHISDVIFSFVKPDVIVFSLNDNSIRQQCLINIIALCEKHNVKHIINVCTDKNQNIKELNNIKLTQLNIPTVIGLRQTDYFAQIVNSLLNGSEVNISPIQVTDFISADDVTSAINKVIEDEIYGIYDVSASYELTYGEIENKIANVLNEFDIKTSGAKYSSIAATNYQPLNSKEFKSLGWKPEVKLKDAIYNSVVWTYYNRWFYNKE